MAAETFSGTTGGTQTLQSYAPTVWAQHPNYTQDAHIGVQGQYAQNLSNIAAAVYRCIGSAYAPSSADYDVFADIAKLTGTNLCEMSVLGRVDATASTYYMGGYKHGTGYRLFKLVAGVATQLGSTVAHTLTSTPEQIKLRMVGDQISLLVDGVVTIGPVTDSSITAAGTAGIYLFNMRETGVADAGSLDNFDIGSSDTTAPTLTSATSSVTGQTTATVGATTDEANGTMYAVVTTSATQPSVAQIVAGQDHTGSAAVYAGNQAISSTGAKTFSATGMTAATAYYAHMVHRDAASNDSNRLSTSQFTTLPNAPTAPTIGANSGITSSGVTVNWTDNSSDETGFIVQVETPSGAGNWSTVGTPAADATSYGVTGLSPSTEYRPRVAATNTGGTSSYSTGTAFTTDAGGSGITLANLERRAGRGTFRGQH